MKTINAILLSLGVAASFSACGHHGESPVGNWTSATPESVTQSVTGAKQATRTLTLDFSAPANGADGAVTMTADYDVTAAVADSVANNGKYTVKAIVKGTWTQSKDDDDDDYLLTFDKNSISVSGVDAPELGPVTDAFINTLSTFSTVEDVEVSKDKKHMTFETKNPEVKYHFVSK